MNGKWEWFKKSNGNVLEGKYLGEIHNGKPYGQGTLTHPNGEKYVGEFKNGFVWSGKGIEIKYGDKYVGEFKDGNEHGQGTMTWLNAGWKYVGEWKDGGMWNGTHYTDGQVLGKYVNGEYQ